jgi:hypothetical protein
VVCCCVSITWRFFFLGLFQDSTGKALQYLIGHSLENSRYIAQSSIKSSMKSVVGLKQSAGEAITTRNTWLVTSSLIFGDLRERVKSATNASVALALAIVAEFLQRKIGCSNRECK